VCRATWLIVGILTLQDNKRELAKAALSGEARQDVMKLTLNDIIGASWPRARS
jgi:hypothetical protein